MRTKMKSGIFLVPALFFALGLSAQQSGGKIKNRDAGGGSRLSIGKDGGVPVGNLSNGYKWMIGLSLQTELPFIEQRLYGTLNSGYYLFFGKSGISNLNLIPLKAGLKYFLFGDLYLQGEAGVSFLANKRHLEADKTAAFVYAPQVGYLFRLRKNYIDIGVRFEGNSKFYQNGYDNNFLGLRISYSLDL